MENSKKALVEYLSKFHRGEKNAISTKDLVALGFCRARDLRFIVRDLRNAGYPICSNTYGYYIAESYAEITSTVTLLRSHIKSIQETIDSMESIRI